MPKTRFSPIYGAVDSFNWHLRPEKQDSKVAGILIINGVKVIYLNPSAYFYLHTYLSLKQNVRRTVWKSAFHLGISPRRARQDWNKLYADLIQASDGCCEGTGIQVLNYAQPFSTPLRVDLALTYNCNNDCTHCYAGGNRQTEELSTREWQDIIDKLHQIGVPQVIFTGGESLLRPDLEILVNHAKNHNMITGLITNGRLLTSERVTNLVKSGLDFVQITVESIKPDVHNQMVGADALEETLMGVQKALNSPLRVTTNTTITQSNADTLLQTLEYLMKIGVSRVGINGIIRAHRGKKTDGIDYGEMKELLSKVLTLCQKQGTEMIWFTPTCYQELNPISLELGVKSCSAASIVLTIEPTGRVIPCQSYFEGLGDARYDSFEKIWNHPLAIQLRERQWVQESCRQCENFTSCGGGCPLEK